MLLATLSFLYAMIGFMGAGAGQGRCRDLDLRTGIKRPIPSAFDNVSISGHPGASPASQRRTASARTRSITLRSCRTPDPTQVPNGSLNAHRTAPLCIAEKRELIMSRR
jgi:hypothetical protein